MQKLYRTILFAPLFFLSACASLTLDEDGCPGTIKSTNLTAQDGNSANKPSFVRLSRDTVKVNKGCPFLIKNTMGHTIHTTSTTPGLTKGPVDGNLKMGPVDCDRVTCPGTFKYTIIVKDIGVLDPRARVL